jgi:pimeloyl-ACP methyl ester carboxylesterase
MSPTTKGTRVTSIALLSAALALSACSPNDNAAREAAAARDSTPAASAGDRVGTNGQYADVNGLRMYYEVHGPANAPGKPLVLLHGAFSQIRTDFSELIPLWSKTRHVIAIEQQGNGHTADIDRPLSYKQMADDTAELLKQLGIENADIFDYSMGGATALVRLEHVVELYHLLGGGVPGDLKPLPASQLAILPGTTHQMIVHRTDWLFSMTNAFLDAPPPQSAAPAPKAN